MTKPKKVTKRRKSQSASKLGDFWLFYDKTDTYTGSTLWPTKRLAEDERKFENDSGVLVEHRVRVLNEEAGGKQTPGFKITEQRQQVGNAANAGLMTPKIKGLNQHRTGKLASWPEGAAAIAGVAPSPLRLAS